MRLSTEAKARKVKHRREYSPAPRGQGIGKEEYQRAYYKSRPELKALEREVTGNERLPGHLDILSHGMRDYEA